MLSGGPGKDGIPSVDSPKYWNVEDANDFLDDGDIVFGLVENGVARAYPQRILVWHEIVNDVVGGVGLAVTYCPLTGTAIAFERGQTEFGVSGRLVNSNLIMFDRDTDTWFPQVLAPSASRARISARHSSNGRSSGPPGDSGRRLFLTPIFYPPTPNFSATTALIPMAPTTPYQATMRRKAAHCSR